MEFKGLKGKLNQSFGFKLEDGKVIDSKHVYCLKCKKQFSYSGSVSSLQYHLRSQHPLFNIATDVKHDKFSADDEVSKLNSSVTGQMNLDSFLEKPVSASKEHELTNKLAMWIVSSCRPINIVNDAGLQEVMQAALNSSTYKLPTRATIMNRIKQLYEVHKSRVCDEIKEAEFVSLTGDFWTSLANDSYLGVTMHWIGNEWNYNDVTLQVKQVLGKHTADQCSIEFEEVAEEWGVTDKVVAICTDNARNIVLGIERSRYANVRCAAHTIQLSINKALTVASVDKLLVKCRKIVGHFKHSSQMESKLLFKQKELGLGETKVQQDIATRWNSTYIMVQSLLKIREAIDSTLTENPSNVLMLSSSEWEMLDKLATTLKPCLDITELLGGQKYVTGSVVIPAVAHLKRLMTISDDTEPGFISRFKAMLVNDLTERISDWNLYEKYEEATALDPRFKTLRCISENKRELVWKRLSLSNLKQQLVSEKKDNLPKRRKLCFEDTSTLLESDQDSANASSIETEIQIYRSLPELDDDFADPLQWWKIHSLQLPHLATIAKNRLCIPATSVPSERVFSAAGIIVNKLRSSLEHSNVNKLVCLKSWLKK